MTTFYLTAGCWRHPRRRDNETAGKVPPLQNLPSMQSSGYSLVTHCKTNERFCHLCATDEEEKSPAVTVARKLHEHVLAGTLDQYTLSERLKDLRGEWVQ